MAINPRLGNMRIPIRHPRLTRTVSLTRLRSLIRCQGWVLGRPNPNASQIILTRMDRLNRITSLPRLSRVNILPRKTRLTMLTSITSLDGGAILNRMAVIDSRTRLTIMVSLTRRHGLIRG